MLLGIWPERRYCISSFEMRIRDDVMATLELSAVAIPVLPVQLALLVEMVPGQVTIVDVKLHEVFLPVAKLSLILDQIHPLEHLLILESVIDWIVKGSGSVLHRWRLFVIPQ
jgi:hypothetical protein